MERNKEFIINSIKMDLHRVVTAVGDITKEIPTDSVKIFLEHAYSDFAKIETLDDREQSLKNSLNLLTNKLESLQDPHKRLRWAEDILTIRCRL